MKEEINCISFSVFGYENKHEQCLDFRSYLRGLEVNIRIAELLYPGWKIHVVTDTQTFNAYEGYFQAHKGKIDLVVVDRQPLCLMMLHRLLPIFRGYSRVACRDSDSLLSYRDRQAVLYWERGTKMAHSMTDSVSHNIPLMGGMCSFKAGDFRNRMGVKTFDELIALAQGIDWNIKGADQTFLNQYVLPRVADSITEHFVLGHPQTFRGDCFNFIHDLDLKEIGVRDELRETNGFAFHLGASGFQTDQTIKFLQAYGVNNDYYNDIEKQFPEVFYWQL